jgi:hypothetical protein
MKLAKLFMLLLLVSGVYTVSAQPVIVGTTATNKNVVLEELTGKTCQYCPDGHKRAAQLRAANPGRVVLVNIHTGSYAAGTPNYRSAWGDYVGGLYTVSGYPTGTVNRTAFGGGTVMDNRGTWTGNAATVLGQASPVNVGANAAVNLDNRQLVVDVEAYYTSAGTGASNNMHTIITQDNIPGPQSGGAAYYPAQILPNGDYNHMHMMRHNLSPNAGEPVATITAMTTYTNQYTYTVPANYNAIAVNLADILVSVYVSEAAATASIVTGSEANMSWTTATPLGATSGVATIDATLGAVCGTTTEATWQVTNSGNAALTTATFEYTVNGGTPGTYQHTFTTPLATGQYADVIVTGISGLSPNGASSTIDLSITMLNGGANPNTNVSNAHMVATASMKSGTSTAVSLALTTDAYGSETTWELVDETTGSTVMQGGPYNDLTAAGTTVQTPVNGTLVDGHCYKFLISDAYGDGINSGYGVGSYTLTAGTTTLSSGGTFTSVDGEKFVYDFATGIAPVVAHDNDIKIMPNPVRNNMALEFTVAELSDLNISVINALGQQVAQVANGAFEGTNVIDVNTGDLVSGVYFLNITSLVGTSTKRFIVQK